MIQRSDSPGILQPGLNKGLSGSVKLLQGLKKISGPTARQAVRQIGTGLGNNTFPEPPVIRCTSAGKVVHADVKTGSRGYGKQPLQGLRFDFNPLESPLLFRAATVRTVSVTKIAQCAPVLTCDTPMADFVQSTGIIAVRKDNLRQAIGAICGQILGFFAAFDQNRPV